MGGTGRNADDLGEAGHLDWTVPGAGLVLTGLGYAVLTLVAWRFRRGRA